MEYCDYFVPTEKIFMHTRHAIISIAVLAARSPLRLRIPISDPHEQLIFSLKLGVAQMNIWNLGKFSVAIYNAFLLFCSIQFNSKLRLWIVSETRPEMKSPKSLRTQ